MIRKTFLVTTYTQYNAIDAEEIDDALIGLNEQGGHYKPRVDYFVEPVRSWLEPANALVRWARNLIVNKNYQWTESVDEEESDE